jgi:putative Holliday junction resolvase
MKRWLGVDHGTKRIGLAVTDEAAAIASPLDVIAAEPREAVFRRIAALAREYDAAGVIVGWPLNTDDTEGPQGRLARRFACELLLATGLEVRLWDERFTSSDADGKLAGLYTRKQKKARHDAVAAAAILISFLSAGPESCAPRPF